VLLLRNLGYAGSFHVNNQPVKSIYQFPLGFRSHNLRSADQHATAHVVAIRSASIFGAISEAWRQQEE